MSDTDTILRTEELTKTFGALRANDGISLSVPRGEIRGIIGPNGSGKTTFFNTVTGFYQPDGGSVTFDGTDITGWKPHRIARRGLGRTFQIVSPFENMTVRQNMMAVQTTDDVDKRARADEILAFLDIDHVAENQASGMSGGQQKLLELARVLMLDPTVIMLDEPAAGVNPAL
jgi:branched-chain amino acid transport system ATP-binding protein